MIVNNLFLLTSEFPYGNSEPFLKNEITVLAEQFDSIVILPDFSQGKNINFVLPSNVQVLSYPKKVESSHIKRVIQSCTSAVQEVIHSNQKIFALKNIVKNFLLLMDLHKKADFLKSKVNRNENNYFYSFWFSNQATMLSILSRQKAINGFFSRAHKFDLYENIGHSNYIPFRKLQLQHVNKVYTVSALGADYLKKLYPTFSNKISYSRLGVFSMGINPLFFKKPYTIVSASNVVYVKRVRLILDILKHSKEELQWIHFGDGNLLGELTDEVKNFKSNNITITLMGRKSNTELMDFFLTQHISLFINVSISEGIPFSIMEAISFGIPVIATDVGGTSEIVNDKIGKLIPADFNPKEVAELIDKNIEKWTNKAFRENAFRQWELNYNATLNYTNFAQNILNHE